MLSASTAQRLSRNFGRAIFFRSYSNGPNDGGFTFKTVRRVKISPRKYILMIIPIATFGLGTWQIQRRKWKLNLIKTLEEKTRTPPIEFPWDVEELKDLEYRRVHVRGTFNHDQELYISPRSRLDKGDNVEGGGLISSSASTGSWIITPFTITERNITILVNRGWVPKNMTFPNTRLEGQIEDEVDLTGVVRLPERRQPFMPKHNEHNVFFHWRDIDTMAKIRNTEPIFLDAILGSTVPGGPIGGQTRVTLRNEHLSYILTWYSLSAVTSYLWYLKYIRKIPLM